MQSETINYFYHPFNIWRFVEYQTNFDIKFRQLEQLVAWPSNN